MSLKDREKKLLILLLIIIVFSIILFVLLPKINSLEKLKEDISVEKIEQSNYETRLNVLNNEINSNKIVFEKSKADYESVVDDKKYNDIKFYNNITDGEIIVELNKFVPVSVEDKFIIDEIDFLDNKDLSDSSETIENFEYGLENEELESEEEINSEESTLESNQDTYSYEENSEDSFSTSKTKQIMLEHDFEENQTRVVFEGYFDSLIKFIENLTNNDYYVAVTEIKINNVALNDPTVSEDIIKGEMIISFPTFDGEETDVNIYSLLDNLYNSNIQDPFKPYDDFIINNDLDNYYDADNESKDSEVTDNSEYTESIVYIEDFSNNDYFFVTNDNRNSGYITNSTKSTDGNSSLKMYYDFYNRNNKNVAYAVDEDESIVLDVTPKEIMIDVFNDSVNENELGVVFRDANGIERESVISSSLNFNGWATCSISLPENMVYPVCMQRFFVKSSGSGIKQEGTVLLDNLRIIEY